jgi:hypothetical protein
MTPRENSQLNQHDRVSGTHRFWDASDPAENRKVSGSIPQAWNLRTDGYEPLALTD